MNNDPLANCLSKIMNAETRAKKELFVRPISKKTKAVLELLRDNQYIGEFTEEQDSRGGKFIINLIGAINKINSIKPNFSVKKDNFEKFEKRFLPARNFGILIVSTSKGMTIHTDAKNKKIGGKLIAYCY